MPVDHEQIYLGFDPGGDKKFGVVILDGNYIKASTVSTVDDAMKWAIQECGSRRPIAAGIDTLLHWATGRSGFRRCDLKLRKKYKKIELSIMAPNSLFGAMAIGGMALAIRLREKWPGIVLNETHPKVLLQQQRCKQYDAKDQTTVQEAIQWFIDQGRYVDPKITGEHEFDAALSAWATQKGLVEGWIDIIENEGDLLLPAGSVRYLWPCNL